MRQAKQLRILARQLTVGLPPEQTDKAYKRLKRNYKDRVLDTRQMRAISTTLSVKARDSMFRGLDKVIY